MMRDATGADEQQRVTRAVRLAVPPFLPERIGIRHINIARLQGSDAQKADEKKRDIDRARDKTGSTRYWPDGE